MPRSEAATFALSLLVVGCDGGAMVVNPGAPSTFTSELVFVRVQPEVILAATSAPHVCSRAQPSSVGFTLNLHAGTSALTVRQVSYHATSVSGIATAPVVVTGDDLRSRFGKTTVSRHGSAAYPLTYSYGCEPGLRLATLHSRIETVDEAGEPHTLRVDSPLR